MTKLKIERRGEDKWCVVVDLDKLGPTPALRWIKSKRAAQEAMERLYTIPVRWDVAWHEHPLYSELSGWRLACKETGRILLDEQARILGV